jgi:hypothetical protein
MDESNNKEGLIKYGKSKKYSVHSIRFR